MISGELRRTPPIRYYCGFIEYVCPLTGHIRELERANWYEGLGIEGHDFVRVHIARSRH